MEPEKLMNGSIAAYYLILFDFVCDTLKETTDKLHPREPQKMSAEPYRNTAASTTSTRLVYRRKQAEVFVFPHVS